MNTFFMAAVVLLALVVGGLSVLGLIVMVKVFLAAGKLKQQIASIPDQLAARQRALNEAQSKIVAAQRQLAKDRGALVLAQAEAQAPIVQGHTEPPGSIEAAIAEELAKP